MKLKNDFLKVKQVKCLTLFYIDQQFEHRLSVVAVCLNFCFWLRSIPAFSIKFEWMGEFLVSFGRERQNQSWVPARPPQNDLVLGRF